MNPHTRKAVEAESVYLAGAESNFMQARGRQFRGTIWQTARFDEGMAVREELARRGLFDPDLLARLPQNRRVVMRGYERRWWWFGKRATGVVIASVLAPPGAYIAGESADSPAPPVGLADLLEHVRRIAPTTDVPHVIGVCSPSGFTDEVRHSHLDLPNVTLVVVEPRADGGWAVTPLSDAADEAICRLFDPDTTARKIERVRQEIEARAREIADYRARQKRERAVARQTSARGSLAEMMSQRQSAGQQAQSNEFELCCFHVAVVILVDWRVEFLWLLHPRGLRVQLEPRSTQGASADKPTALLRSCVACPASQ